MKPRSSSVALAIVLLAALAAFCSESNKGGGVRDQPAPFSGGVTQEPLDSLLHEANLLDYLNSQLILTFLGVKRVIILEANVDKVIIGSAGTKKPLGEVYYTIQDGWHLKRENERMEHKPGKGWLIWEQMEQER